MAALGWIAGHRVAAIENQVEKHLLELDVVARSERQVVGQSSCGL